MKNIIMCSAILLSILFSCSTDKTIEPASSLYGAWELISGEWYLGDTTFVMPSEGFNLQSIKYYSKGFFYVSGKDHPMLNSYGLSGKYHVNGDLCYEVIEYSTLGNIGEKHEFEFILTDSVLTLKSDWLNEKWIRIE